MAHEVLVTLPERKIGKADVNFTVKRDGYILGTLLVSKGAIVWVLSGHEFGRKMSWSVFDSVMQTNGRSKAGLAFPQS